MGQVIVEGMPVLVNEIAPENAADLVDQLESWELDLLGVVTTNEDKRVRGWAVLMLRDLFAYYRGAVVALASGDSVDVYANRQLGTLQLGHIVAALGNLEAEPQSQTLEGLGKFITAVALAERDAAPAEASA